MVFTLGALKYFANFAGKIHVLESLFKKASDLQACKFIKKRLQPRYFPVKFARFSTALFQHLRWLATCNSHNDKLYLKMHSLTKNLL